MTRKELPLPAVVLAIMSMLGGCGHSTAAQGASSPAAPRGPRLSDDAIIDSMLARLATAAGCPASHRVWCLAANGWAGGTAGDLPAGSQSFVGVSVGLERERADDELLSTDVALSAFLLRVDGDRTLGLITDIPPENAAEKRVVRAALNSIAKVLKGSDERVDLAPSLMRHIATLPPQATYPLVRGADGWRMEGKSNARIRKVGAAWIILEVPRNGPEGIFVNIYPD